MTRAHSRNLTVSIIMCRRHRLSYLLKLSKLGKPFGRINLSKEREIVAQSSVFVFEWIY